MTKKDYIKIGKILNNQYKLAKETNNNTLISYVHETTETLINMFKSDNKLFNEKTFRNFVKGIK